MPPVLNAIKRTELIALGKNYARTQRNLIPMVEEAGKKSAQQASPGLAVKPSTTARPTRVP
jgi:hypothetical protein